MFSFELRNTKEKSHSLQEQPNATLLNKTQHYTVTKELSSAQQEQTAASLQNPVFESVTINQPNPPKGFSWALLVGFKPGVTDNLGHTVRETIEDLFKISFDVPHEDIYSAEIYYFSGDLSEKERQRIAAKKANDLIQRTQWLPSDQYRDKGFPLTIPKVDLHHTPTSDQISLHISDEALIEIGKKGILNPDGTSRGPLALDLTQMQTIRDYFAKIGRDPFDIELESIAQTWSEHCKHTIFACPIDDLKEGLYKGLIKRATEDIRRTKEASGVRRQETDGSDSNQSEEHNNTDSNSLTPDSCLLTPPSSDFCVSVFSDNAGGIVFDEDWVVTDKAETHNSPSALDPFGGAITGIVGVNRDCLGYGKGAKPIMNRYGFCCGYPEKDYPYFRQKGENNPILPSRQILDGVVAGVKSGGNQSGIPCPQGFVYFDDRYAGKPLVFAGTVGLIPRKINGEESSEKKAHPGDHIVIAGGRVGLDGIHGATFSSEALDEGSPATAVQIGDPVTQKKMSDTIVREARHLYNAVTDNGAGGISCSIAEMAESSDCGCLVELEKVPLKYPNLSPWEIWISESQERMTFAVAPEKSEELITLFAQRGVEAVVVGTFTDTHKCQVQYEGQRIMDLDMAFLHDGWPRRQLITKAPEANEKLKIKNEKEPSVVHPPLVGGARGGTSEEQLLSLLRHPNITSYEFISRQYDHNVQGNGVVGPLQGKGRVNGSASVTQPVFGNLKGIVTSQALNPEISEIDPYAMAATSIDDAIAAAVAVGANVDHLALMDNFCWCSSDDPERLWQLKQAVQACYDTAVGFGTPFISGKDSMYNDFRGFDAQDQEIKISVPPTLLISGLSVIPDVQKAMTLDFKEEGDLVYLVGNGECYESRVEEALDRYRRVFQASQESLIASCIHVSRGGLAVALAKSSIGGQVGIEVETNQDLFEKVQSQFVVSINPQNKTAFEALFPDSTPIGTVTNERFSVNQSLSLSISEITTAYHETFQHF